MVALSVSCMPTFVCVQVSLCWYVCKYACVVFAYAAHSHPRFGSHASHGKRLLSGVYLAKHLAKDNKDMHVNNTYNTLDADDADIICNYNQSKRAAQEAVQQSKTYSSSYHNTTFCWSPSLGPQSHATPYRQGQHL